MIQISTRAAARCARAAAVGVVAIASQSHAADFKVFYPNVTGGEFEFENRAFDTLDKEPSRTNGRNYTNELGYGVTDWWFTEIENEFKKDPQDKWRYTALASENIFQILPQGSSFVDLGFFAEYEIAMRRGDSDNFNFGPIIQKQFGRWLTTANIFVSADIGGAEPDSPHFNYGLEVKYLLTPLFSPGFQAFGDPGPFTHFNRFSEQDHRAGPVIFGTWNLFPGKINYEAGYLLGLTHDSPSGTMKFLLEYEISL
ncbi:MAG TPA: hypothetical protein VKZ79_12080 [Alphaproteobacteria bacterium]|nr:hypothetical protein [Alphaproteobacteria bacterium]